MGPRTELCDVLSYLPNSVNRGKSNVVFLELCSLRVVQGGLHVRIATVEIEAPRSHTSQIFQIKYISAVASANDPHMHPLVLFRNPSEILVHQFRFSAVICCCREKLQK
jgi:hypothetical protein